MYQRYYDGYPTEAYTPGEKNEFTVDDAAAPSQMKDADCASTELSMPSSHNEEIQVETASPAKSGWLSSIKSDDILLIALLIILAAEAPDDAVMPLIIGYILLSDILPI